MTESALSSSGPAAAPGAAAPAHNLPEYSVGQISTALKRTVETAFDRVRVRGEVTGFKRAGSGHLYFALKDSEALLDACCWKPSAVRLAVQPQDGLEVIATGRLTTFPGRSKYQMIVETVELAGAGALLALIEERRRRLTAEGLFDAARKPALPYLPAVIGIVTSPTGAVIRDILHRLADRFPRRVLVWPVLVQGTGSAEQIAAAIAGFDALAPGGRIPRPDLLIVARGGGSVEDLMAFNEELVVRAAAACRIPLISAVGHETDTTLIDFAAARRAPTPTAAAEMAVPVRAQLLAQLYDLARRQEGGLERALEDRRRDLAALRRGLGDPRRLVEIATQRLDDRAERLDRAAGEGVTRRRGQLQTLAARLPHPRQQIQIQARHLAAESRALDTALVQRLRGATTEQRAATDRLAALADRLALAAPRLTADRAGRLAALGRLLDGFSYRKTLERGFVVVRDAGGQPLLSATGARPGDGLQLDFADGRLAVTVPTDPAGAAGPASGAAPRTRPAATRSPSPTTQGSLL